MKLLRILFTVSLSLSWSVANIVSDNTTTKVDTQSVLSILSPVKILWTLLFFLLGYIFITLVSKALAFFAEKSSRARISIKSFIPVLRIILWAFLIVITIKIIYNPPEEMVIGALASVALAIGFATQDLLKNIFGGLMLLFERPFRVGDKIKVGENYGEVTNIGLRATHIVTPDDSVVVIPNMELMNRSLSNSNAGELNCQVVANIMLPAAIPTDKVRKIAIEAAQVSRYVYLNKPIEVLFTNEIYQRKSFLVMEIKAYVMDIRYEFQFKSDMTEMVIKELLTSRIVNENDLE